MAVTRAPQCEAEQDALLEKDGLTPASLLLLCSPETRGSGQKAFVVIHIWLK